MWMALYWMLEPIPLAVTALMPLVLFPLLDILGTMDTARTYFNDLGFVIFASLILSSAMNASNLHTRLALKALLLLGTNNQRREWEMRSLCLAFMLTTMALSMWIPGTLAVLHEDSVAKAKKVMLLSVAYAANIGGSGTLIGTTGNLVLARIIERQVRFPESKDITFSSWMLCNVPPMLTCVLLGWAYIQWLLRSVTWHGLGLTTG
ncbi:conserved hypothetical protein [Ixodes scapularis]|uniref:Citrate transporter-like domain-containing protein n=1 Tax=Ixodes scapularis TaxID=6945 RepID=B7QGN1_IXOSC|nr:conserved hypothetical protein [Ixodes scapularis]|eukprot:XP_002400084.1 conserved hypothetical protein [Ixodes scapularis]